MASILTYSTVRKTSPLMQFAWVAAVALASMFLFGLLPGGNETEWYIAVAALGFYTWMNIILGALRPGAWLRYVAHSYLFFAALCVLLILAAQWLTAIPFSRLPEYQMTLVATFVFYFTGTGVAALFRYAAKMFGIEY